jgi:hypothetical protein
VAFTPAQGIEAARTQKWPFPPLRTLQELKRALLEGYDLVIVNCPRTLAPIYRLMRNGEVSPTGYMDPTVPNCAFQKRGYFTFGEKIAHKDWPEGVQLLVPSDKGAAKGWRRAGSPDVVVR